MSQDTTMAALKKHGPMTAAEIAATTGYSKPTVDANLRRLRRVPWEAVIIVDEIGPVKWARRTTKVWAVKE